MGTSSLDDAAAQESGARLHSPNRCSHSQRASIAPSTPMTFASAQHSWNFGGGNTTNTRCCLASFRHDSIAALYGRTKAAYHPITCNISTVPGLGDLSAADTPLAHTRSFRTGERLSLAGAGRWPVDGPYVFSTYVTEVLFLSRWSHYLGLDGTSSYMASKPCLGQDDSLRLAGLGCGCKPRWI